MAQTGKGHSRQDILEALTHNSEQVCDGSLQHTVLKQLEKGQKLTFYVLFVKQNHVM